MGRRRKEISERKEGKNSYGAYFRHPFLKNEKGKPRVMRIPLGGPTEFHDNLKALNEVFLEPKFWHDPPAKIMPDWMRSLWLDGHDGTEADDSSAVDGSALARKESELRHARRAADYWKGLALQYRREIEHLKGKKFRPGPSLTLEKARDTYIADYKGRDPDHTRNVRCDIDRFIEKFGKQTLLDDLDGKEQKIDAWLRGLVDGRGGNSKKEDKDKKVRSLVGPGRRNQIRMAVLRFLEMSGVRLNRKLIKAATAKEIRAKRGPIRWLQRPQAEAFAKRLGEFDQGYWEDLFRVQVGTGLRPEEIITLKKEDFTADLDQLTLSPYKHLTLKTGSRTIVVPLEIRKIIERRLGGEKRFVFPNPLTGEPWARAHWYERKFRRILRKAVKKLNDDPDAKPEEKIAIVVDARIGRRTCCSSLLNAGVSVEIAAEILGDDPDTIWEHYGAILPHKRDPSKAVLG